MIYLDWCKHYSFAFDDIAIALVRLYEFSQLYPEVKNAFILHLSVLDARFSGIFE